MNGISKLIISIAALISPIAVQASDLPSIAELDQASIQEIQTQLLKNADDFVRREFPGNPIRAVRSVRLDEPTNSVTVDLSPSVITASPGPGELERPLHQLVVLIDEFLKGSVNVKWVHINIDGKSLYENYPDLLNAKRTVPGSLLRIASGATLTQTLAKD